jgi:hypothetical protein
MVRVPDLGPNEGKQRLDCHPTLPAGGAGPAAQHRRRGRGALFNAITVPKATSVLTVEGQHACKLGVGCAGRQPSDDELTTASSQGEKTNAREDQARQSCSDDGTGDCDRLSINEVIHNGYTRAELTRRQSYIATYDPDTADFD